MHLEGDDTFKIAVTGEFKFEHKIFLGSAADAKKIDTENISARY